MEHSTRNMLIGIDVRMNVTREAINPATMPDVAANAIPTTPVTTTIIAILRSFSVLIIKLFIYCSPPFVLRQHDIVL
jgi:hypothetical protein